jgi:hypothetical protein
MKLRWVYITILSVLLIIWISPSSNAEVMGLPAKIIKAYGGKIFTNLKDSEFINYDIFLRNYLVKRINKRYGISLDAKLYSGLDLLEIEAFLKCRKSDEPIDNFLKMFHKAKD